MDGYDELMKTFKDAKQEALNGLDMASRRKSLLESTYFIALYNAMNFAVDYIDYWTCDVLGGHPEEFCDEPEVKEYCDFRKDIKSITRIEESE